MGFNSGFKGLKILLDLLRRVNVTLIDKNGSHEFVPRNFGCVPMNLLITNLASVLLLM